MTKELTALNEGFVLHTSTETNVFPLNGLLKWACLAVNTVINDFHPCTIDLPGKVPFKANEADLAVLKIPYPVESRNNLSTASAPKLTVKLLHWEKVHQ